MAQVLCQELVLNGGFEMFKRCPKGPSGEGIAELRYLRDPNGGSGMFHNCSGAMPANWAGHQQAYDGEGYVGLVLTAHGGGECAARSFVELQLAEPLVNGGKYRLSFQVSLAEHSGYATDRIGAHFSSDKLGRKQGLAARVGTAHVDNPAERFLMDTVGWMQVDGIYNAQGGERYILIGNLQACDRTSRRALTNNQGEGVLQNMKRKAHMDLDPDRARGLRRRVLATQSYAFLDAVSLVPMAGHEGHELLDRASACPDPAPKPADAQELVPDPRFDRNVPERSSAWKNASGGTPDFLQGRAGIYLHSAVNPDHREYIRTDLVEPLDPCGTYAFRMQVLRNAAYGYAVDRIGLALVDTFVMDRRRDLLPFQPSWSTPGGRVMDTTTEWIELCGEFQAPGCSRTLVVGNFHSDTATTVLVTDPAGGPFAYYFVNEVSLWRTGTVEGCKLSCTPEPISLDVLITDPPPSPSAWEIHFDLAADLPKEAVGDIAEQVLGLLAEQPGTRVFLAGHTDPSGTEEMNQALSMRRALAVRNALMQLGVPAAVFQLTAMGSSEPIADNATPEGRARNRRVEVSILMPKP